MNWKKEAENDLKNLEARRAAVENMAEKIEILEDKYVSMKGLSNDTPVMGGQSQMEFHLINNIVERERLKNNISVVRRLIEMTEKGLAGLDERQRMVLDGFFIHRASDYIDRLCSALYIEKSQLYRIKDEAIYRFTLTMYGIVDL